MEKYIIGIMSGSSLDGIDLAYCHIKETNGNYSFEILTADCVPYSEAWVNRLRNLPLASGKELWQSHADLGRHFGEVVKAFIGKEEIGNVDFVASHGHTIFHFPEQKFTTQIGEGAAMAAACNLPVVCDFRTTDVASGGTGAPIVPIADKLLFCQYDFCLNLGGIANVSAKNSREILAYDIAPCNQLLNAFAQELNVDFDDKGAIAKSGKVEGKVLKAIMELEFHNKLFPKSLDNSFSTKSVLPIFEQMATKDKLSTAVEYIANCVSKEIETVGEALGLGLENATLLATGGGAFNTFLMERIAAKTAVKIVTPQREIVQYKEAVAMALMGFLRWEGKANVLSSVTGANKNTVNGAIYLS
ncbi:MAG: anhydro-N-acetylmuramic acid kinase [Bacteroidetes bacterium 37-13]|nr:MAG: anhydro-N-acetylmuramic acid kinase [Bacteroidetes bacterium 37-13]